ncbi:hypothetical protein STW0522ENT66_17700 [Enterobacter roggenkampii]|nr:hypothetical protein STW0522ENT66_17700 [Enterobacter roggenkampii]SAE28368.1 Uncharacterised protein [Enterobacter roggenkampii]
MRMKKTASARQIINFKNEESDSHGKYRIIIAGILKLNVREFLWIPKKLFRIV